RDAIWSVSPPAHPTPCNARSHGAARRASAWKAPRWRCRAERPGRAWSSLSCRSRRYVGRRALSVNAPVRRWTLAEQGVKRALPTCEKRALMRPSGRAPDQLRPIVLEPGFAVHAEGSCLAKFGNTHVLVAASVEERVPPFLRNTGKGWITAEYGML